MGEENNKFKENNEKLLAEVNRMGEENNKLAENNQNLADEINRLKAEIDRMAEENKKFAENNENLKKEVQEVYISYFLYGQYIRLKTQPPGIFSSRYLRISWEEARLAK